MQLPLTIHYPPVDVIPDMTQQGQQRLVNFLFFKGGREGERGRVQIACRSV
jgi:hypothetical protein